MALKEPDFMKELHKIRVKLGKMSKNELMEALRTVEKKKKKVEAKAS